MWCVHRLFRHLIISVHLAEMGSSLCLGVGGLTCDGMVSHPGESMSIIHLNHGFGLMHRMARRRIQLLSINLLYFSLVTGIKSRGITLEMASHPQLLVLYWWMIYSRYLVDFRKSVNMIIISLILQQEIWSGQFVTFSFAVWISDEFKIKSNTLYT